MPRNGLLVEPLGKNQVRYRNWILIKWRRKKDEICHLTRRKIKKGTPSWVMFKCIKPNGRVVLTAYEWAISDEAIKRLLVGIG